MSARSAEHHDTSEGYRLTVLGKALDREMPSLQTALEKKKVCDTARDQNWRWGRTGKEATVTSSSSLVGRLALESVGNDFIPLLLVAGVSFLTLGIPTCR